MQTGTYPDVEHRVVWPDGSVHWALGLSHYFGPRLGVGLRYLGHYEWYDAAGLAPAALSSGLRINPSARF